MEEDDGPQTKGQSAEKDNFAILRKLTYLIINNMRIDLFTCILLTVALPPTKIETLK